MITEAGEGELAPIPGPFADKRAAKPREGKSECGGGLNEKWHIYRQAH